MELAFVIGKTGKKIKVCDDKLYVVVNLCTPCRPMIHGKSGNVIFIGPQCKSILICRWINKKLRNMVIYQINDTFYFNEQMLQ